MSFWSGISQLRTILTGETDYDSSNNEELNEQIRENIEALLMLLLDTGDSGSATSDPPNDTTGVLTDTAAAYATEEHNTRTLLMTSGNAIGNMYTIDDTTATTLVCTGDNLYADGVRLGDTYKILYDLKVNADGHDHDGVNSKQINASIDQAALKSTTGSVSHSGASWSKETLPGGEYGFYPRIKMDDASAYIWGATIAYQAGGTFLGNTSYVTQIQLLATASYDIYALQRYVQSSGEVHWVFVLRDKTTKKIKSRWQAPDHPCFGNGNNPALCPHPFGSYDKDTDEIVVINPSKDEVLAMRQACKSATPDQPDRDLLEVITQDYDIDEKSKPKWPDVPVTVGLPDDWEEAWLERRRVRPIKMVIPKPKGVLVKKLRRKAQG